MIQARFSQPILGEARDMFEPLPELTTLVRTVTDKWITSLTWGSSSSTVTEIKVSAPIDRSVGRGSLANAAGKAYKKAVEEADKKARALADAKAAAEGAKLAAA